jgi:hypothetical protein
MDCKNTCSEVLQVGEKEIVPFEEIDPYNHNKIKGFICRKGDHRYGAVYIEKVNDVECPQIIWCTPKLHYPFGRTEGDERVYSVKGNILSTAYEKLDGTNICCYSYRDCSGKRYVSFKTRITPFLRENRFLNAFMLWNEVLKDFSSRGINLSTYEPVLSGKYSLSFELYGQKNQLKVIYDILIDAKFLFAVMQENHEVIPPYVYFLQEGETLKAITNPPVIRPQEIDFKTVYEKYREVISEISEITEDGRIRTKATNRGIEGYVFYSLINNHWTMLKCKSAQMEEAHWANGALPEEVIQATTWNALESCDELTVEYVNQLLSEEFSTEQIAVSVVRVEKAIKNTLEKLKLKLKIVDLLNQYKLTREHDKKTVLSTLSKHFTKYEMRLVYSILSMFFW